MREKERWLNFRFVQHFLSLYSKTCLHFFNVRLRLWRRLKFRFVRLLVFLFFRIWVKAIHGIENLPARGPALIVSNHLSYYDFLILGSFIRPPIVFVAVTDLDKRPLIGWFTRFDIVIYVNREKPGYGFLRELMRHLQSGKLVVIYPEGTRSRSGKMLKPKIGFVKIALKSNVPIIPVGMKGTFEILPPHSHVPRLKRCEVFIGKKIYISPQTEMFRDIFFSRRGIRKFEKLNNFELQLIANRIMNSIREMVREEWENPTEIEKLEACLRARSKRLPDPTCKQRIIPEIKK